MPTAEIAAITENLLSNKKPLLSLLSKFFDVVLQNIAEKPRFLQNDSAWSIWDQSTIKGMLQSAPTNAKNLQVAQHTLQTIRESGPTGVGYILAHLPPHRNANQQRLDDLLLNWQLNLPKGFDDLATDSQKMKVIQTHTAILPKLDQLFEMAIFKSTSTSALQENMLRLTSIRSELPRMVDNLERMQQKYLEKKDMLFALELHLAEKSPSSREIEEQERYHFELATLLSTLDVEIMRVDQLRKEEIELENAVMHDRRRIEEEAYPFILQGMELLPLSDILSPEANALQSFIRQTVDHLIEREWQRSTHDNPGLFLSHLQTRQANQFELETTLDQRLRSGASHSMHESQFTHPIDRTIVETHGAEDATDFRDIIIAANYLAQGGAEGARSRQGCRVPEEISHLDGFIHYEEPGFIETSIAKLQAFLKGEHLSLSETQLAILQSILPQATVSQELTSSFVMLQREIYDKFEPLILDDHADHQQRERAKEIQQDILKTKNSAELLACLEERETILQHPSSSNPGFFSHSQPLPLALLRIITDAIEYLTSNFSSQASL